MKIALGGMSDAQRPETQPILQRAIRAGVRIHSCYFYGDALDSIAKAADATGIEPSLTLKIYFQSDAEGLYAPVPTQLERIRKRLKGFSFKGLHLQLCCNPAFWLFDDREQEFDNFLNVLLKRDFPDTRLLVESFVDWAPNIQKLLTLTAIDGLIFYNNSIMRELRPDIFAQVIAAGSGKYLAAMRVLGGGEKADNDTRLIPDAHRTAWQTLFRESGAKSYVDFNIMYAKAADCLKYHVLSVSSLQHLDSVLEKAESLPALDRQLFSGIEKLKDAMWRSSGVANPYFYQPVGNPFTATGLRRLKGKVATMLKRTMDRASRRSTTSPWTAA
jgi:hypothetical protein